MQHPGMNTQLPLLLQKYLTDSINKEELTLLNTLVNDAENNKELSAFLDEYLLDIPIAAETSSIVKEKSALKLLERITESSVRRVHLLKTTWFRYAAAVILILCSAAYFWLSNKKTEPSLASAEAGRTLLNTDIAPGRDRAVLTLANGRQIILDSAQGNIVRQGSLTVVNSTGKLDYEGIGTAVEFHTLTTPKGGQYQLVLPDGSKVWLNAASSITYPTVFVGKDRTVSITGEAYFEVANDKSKVFHVRTPKEEITVLGTNFNINAYSNEETSKTSLLEGAIKIGNTILKPGQAYMNGKVVTTNIEQDIAWKKGFFNFEDADLPAVMRQLERWYDIEVKYKGTMHERVFSGELSKNLPLSEIINILKDIHVNFRMEGRTLVIE